MFADLHAHYPMRVLSHVNPGSTSKRMRSLSQGKPSHRLRAAFMCLAHLIGNAHDWDGEYRIDVEKLRQGKVALAMSVLFRPFDEMDLRKPYAAPPDDGYFDKLLEDLRAVEAEVAGHGNEKIRIVRERAQLEGALADGVPALVHAVEGGFHLGGSDKSIEANVEKLAECGVGYVTVAHLFFRGVATNANAVPFIPDRLYSLLFPQRDPDRLTPRGETLVRSLVENRILVDLSHMDPPAICETLAYMDEIDRERTMPVISTHAGFRFGAQLYMHGRQDLKKIANRGGVVGLILAQHQLNNGLRPWWRKHTKTFGEARDILFRHIDAIAEATGDGKEPSYDHIAIGSDLDGFIKPTISGIKDISNLPCLETPLRKRYGDEIAEKIMWKNALRVLRKLWPEESPQPGVTV